MEKSNSCVPSSNSQQETIKLLPQQQALTHPSQPPDAIPELIVTLGRSNIIFK